MSDHLVLFSFYCHIHHTKHPKTLLTINNLNLSFKMTATQSKSKSDVSKY